MKYIDRPRERNRTTPTKLPGASSSEKSARLKPMDIANKLPAAPETVRRAERRATRGAALIGAGLYWRRIGSGWRLFDGRRRFGEIVPDSTYPNMWRPVLTGGRLGEMANIIWAKHAVLEAAVRELEWEGRRNHATDRSKCPEKRGVSEGARPPSRSDVREATYPAPQNAGAGLKKLSHGRIA